MASEPLVIPEDLKIVYGVVCDGHKVSPSSPYIRKLIERIAALEAQLDALRAENTNIRAIDKGRVELVAALRALLEKFDKAAEAILEDGGCIHNQAPVICGVCKPFIAAREAFALHCREEYALIAARREAEWTLIDASMRFTKHHILAYPQDGLSSDDTFVMAYSGGYRTGQDALNDDWMYVKKLDRPINAPQEPA